MSEKMSTTEVMAEEVNDRKREADRADEALLHLLRTMERNLTIMVGSVESGHHVSEQISQSALRLVELVARREKAHEEVRRAEFTARMIQESAK